MPSVFEMNLNDADVVVCGTVERLDIFENNRAIAVVSADLRIKGICPDRFNVELGASNCIAGRRFLFCLENLDRLPGAHAASFSTGDFPLVPLFEPSAEEHTNHPYLDHEIGTIDGWHSWRDACSVAIDACADPLIASGKAAEVNDGVAIYPKISATERHFLRVISTPDPKERIKALLVLREFNTPRSIAAIQGLMNDPAHVDSGKASHARYYPVRAAAREALEHLGARIPPSRIEDALVDYQPLTLHARRLVVTLLLFVAAIWLLCRPMPRRYRSNIVIAVVWLVMIASVGVIWWRSFGVCDELVFSHGVRLRIATYNGLLQTALIHNWPDSREALLESFRVEREAPTSEDYFGEKPYPWWTEEVWTPLTPGPNRPFPISWAMPDLFGAPPPPRLEMQRTISKRTEFHRITVVSGQAGDSVGGMQPFTMVRLPIVYVMALLALAPAAMAIMLARRQVRRIQRRRRGQCVRCGYDLRASIGRCPECGSMAPVVPARVRQS